MTRPAHHLRSLVLIAIVSACSSDGATIPAEPPDPVQAAAVTLGSSSFSPSHVAVFEGGTVTWNNTSGVTHNITFSTNGAPTNVPSHSSGSNARDFAAAGTFNYHCTLHSGMNGRVTVVP